MKICSECNHLKDASEFYKCHVFKDGLQYKCKVCANKYSKSYKTSQHGNSICNKLSRKYTQQLKEQVYSHYGKLCNCCGENNIDFLTIDHVNNDGHKDKKLGKTTKLIMSYIIKNNYPNSFQILCMNCNFGKRKTGICPHKFLLTQEDRK